ncbi:MAG: heme utilization cystosolic carrier protein HutX [Desulfomicrobium sp.]|nr:heme utilization cystosolic carrier protein HutX [Desulfomicrobium sp.]
MFTSFLTPDLIAKIRHTSQDEPRLILRDLAIRYQVPEGAVAQALPLDMRRFARPELFDFVWQEMTTWSWVTLIAITAGMVLEYGGVLPKGSHGHGMFNLHAPDHPLSGHFFVDNLGAICFLSKPFMGLESHSVQFYDQQGAPMCAVYVGRKGRELIVEVRQAFMTLRDQVCIFEEEK